MALPNRTRRHGWHARWRTTGAAITLLRVLPESVLQADGTANAAVNHTLERVASELVENGVQVNSVVRDVVQQILD